MSASNHRVHYAGDAKSLLDALVDFGPDEAHPIEPANQDVNSRLKSLVKKLQELNARIDKVSNNY